MSINKPDSSINFRFGTLAGYKQATKSPEDIYFVYTPADATTADKAYGVIYVNGIQFGSNVADLAVGGEGVDSSIVFQHLNADGTIEPVEMAMISVKEHKQYETVVKQIGSLDGSLLKNINVNGVPGTVANNIASVTIDGDDIKVGGNGAYADSSIDTALAMIDASLQSAISAAGVTSFANQKGDITIRGDQDASGAVNLTMVGKQLQADVVGLGTAAYKNSDAFDASGAAAAVLGTNTDTSAANTVYGAKAYAEALAKDASTIAEHTEHGASNGIDVSVTTENGSVKSVTVNAPNFADTYDLKGAAIDASNNAYNSAKAYTDASIQALNYTNSDNGYVTAVSQTNGKIAVTKSALPDGTFKVKVGGVDKVTFTDNANADASIDFVGGNNITVTEANGVITIAADNKTTPNDGKLTITGNGTTAREFTANQSTDSALDISAGSYATVEATTGKITVGVNGTNAVTANSSALVESGAVHTAVEAAKTASAVTVEKLATAEAGYLSSYAVKQNGVQVGATINIPKDFLVKAATLETVDVADQPYIGAKVGDKYIDFEIRTYDSSASASGDHIYLPVNDLVDVYTGGNGIEISAANVVSAKVDTDNANGLSVGANGIAMALSSSTAAGAMSAADKAKLDGITDASFNAWNAAQPNKIETIHVNNVAATIDNVTKDASVTIDGGSILVGGNGAHKNDTVAAAIESAISAAGVTKFGGQTGDITIDNVSTTTEGHVTFTMSGNKLTAVADNVAPANVVTSIAEASANDSSNGVSVTVITQSGSVTGVEVDAPNFGNIYETKDDASSKKAEIDASIAALKTKDAAIDNYTVNGKKISTNPVLSGADVSVSGSYVPVADGVVTAGNTLDTAIHALDASNANQETRLTAVENQLMWHTL